MNQASAESTIAKAVKTNQLIDSFGRKHSYLRISVTDRCNLRCTYCMPPQGVAIKPKAEMLTFEEVTRLANVFVNLGINKIRITGGEPFVRKDLSVLLHNLRSISGLETLAMTTNGVMLAENIDDLKHCGLNALNVSLDTLKPERFFSISKRDEFARVMAGIYRAIDAGFNSVKINCVVMKGINDDEILDFVEFVKNKKANIRFIEYMPFPDNQWCEAGLMPYADIKSLIETQYKLEPTATEPSAVARDFRLLAKNGTSPYLGTVSFITSMTDSFCSSCNRLRLTCDGFIKSCLFYQGEINLKEALRSGASDREIERLILEAVWNKPEKHAAAEELATMQNRAMVEIGG
jgi:cyclic pyranopterin phosphate synthase